MLYVYSIVFAVLFLSAETLAQTTAPTPSGNPSQRNISPVMADNARFDRLRSIEMMNPKNQTPRHPLLDPKKGIYRKPGKDEITALAVDEKFLTQYSAFLRNENSE